MGIYTTTVKKICEDYAGTTVTADYSNIDEVLASAIPHIFNADFPIFDENYRYALCKKILMHYFTREIAYETVGLWKLKLRAKMNEIMPYYNQMYNSELLLCGVDILNDTDYTRTGTNNKSSNTSGNNTTTNINTNKSMDAFSDTPQGALTDVENLNYLTNARQVDANGNSTSNGTFNSTIGDASQYAETIRGKMNSTSYSKLLTDFRKTFMNIDMDIIEELKDLFFLIWRWLYDWKIWNA